ncbi:lipid II flippase MurJ [Devosia sp. A369]
MLLAGRVAGFGREIQISAVLGLSRDADFAIVMLTTPDLFVNLLLAGGLSAALIPEFRRVDRGARTRLFFTATLVVGAVFGLIALVIALFPSLLMLAFAPGYSAVPPSEYATQFAIAALAIPLAGMAGVTTALLNSEEKFLVAGSGTLIFNVTIVGMLVFWLYPGQELTVLATSIAVAALLRYGSQLAVGLKHLSFNSPQADQAKSWDLARRFVQALASTTLVLLIPVILRAVMSLNGTGNIAAYNFATKLVELPIGIAITTISAVAFPALSRALVAGKARVAESLFATELRRSLGMALAITVPCVWFARPLVELVFGHGSMTADDLTLIGQIASIGFLTLPAIAISSMATALLNARHQTGLLLKNTVACTLLVPLAVIPGIVTGNVLLSVSVLPLFHFIFALVIGRATQHPLFGNSVWLLANAARPALIGVAITAVFAGLELSLGTVSAFVSPIAALGAVLVSVLVVGALPAKSAER